MSERLSLNGEDISAFVFAGPGTLERYCALLETEAFPTVEGPTVSLALGELCDGPVPPPGSPWSVIWTDDAVSVSADAKELICDMVYRGHCKGVYSNIKPVRRLMKRWFNLARRGKRIRAMMGAAR